MTFSSRLQLFLTSGSDIRPPEGTHVNTTRERAEGKLQESKALHLISTDVVQLNSISIALVSQFFKV